MYTFTMRLGTGTILSYISDLTVLWKGVTANCGMQDKVLKSVNFLGQGKGKTILITISVLVFSDYLKPGH